MRLAIHRRGKKMCYHIWWYFSVCDTGEMTPGWQAAIESWAENIRKEIDAEVLAQILKESK